MAPNVAAAPDSSPVYPDLADVKGQAHARRALEVAASGQHSLLFYGPPGTGKSMLAQRLPGLLPPMNDDEALESAAVHSIEGGFRPERWKIRPIRSPHHSASTAALVASSGVAAGATPIRLPRPRQECAVNTDDPCCKSCGQAAGTCPADPTCVGPNGGLALLSAAEDDVNLRCWDQKRRFGIDFLYPVDRYVQAFSSPMIADRAGNIVPNPIFSDLNPMDPVTTIRGPQQVLLAGIVGVPWQDIARDKTDLKKGFKNAAELAVAIAPNGPTTWDVILGDSATNKKPLDPLMLETYLKRTGTNPITGDMLVNATMALGNPINGHEWTIAQNDLQYACITALLAGTERDCTDTSLASCDCTNANNDNPLCLEDPVNFNRRTLQVRMKAYPGLRHLAVLKGLGDQALVGSICPAQLVDMSNTATDFGYQPTLDGIAAWVKRRGCSALP